MRNLQKQIEKIYRKVHNIKFHILIWQLFLPYIKKWKVNCSTKWKESYNPVSFELSGSIFQCVCYYCCALVFASDGKFKTKVVTSSWVLMYVTLFSVRIPRHTGIVEKCIAYSLWQKKCKADFFGGWHWLIFGNGYAISSYLYERLLLVLESMPAPISFAHQYGHTLTF